MKQSELLGTLFRQPFPLRNFQFCFVYRTVLDNELKSGTHICSNKMHLDATFQVSNTNTSMAKIIKSLKFFRVLIFF